MMIKESQNLTKIELKKQINKSLRAQGFAVKGNHFYIDTQKSNIRSVHSVSRMERIKDNVKFLNQKISLIDKYLLNSTDIDISKIKPRIIEVKSNTVESDLFRWWNLVWWSLPYEKSYGRQIRLLVWDDYHNTPIGLINLQSPIISWKHRDEYLDLSYGDKEFWINQSMNAQRIGAFPPYNKILGGKLIASLMTSQDVVDIYHRKYQNSITHLKKRFIPSNLLFITTTGAFGKSSIYNRLKDYSGNPICQYLGLTQGMGSFHIPLTLYESFIQYLEQSGGNTDRGFGNGPSRKMRIIDKVMSSLGYKKGSFHGVKRAVYFFNLTKNIHDVIHHGQEPIWRDRSVDKLSEYWITRWAQKRLLQPDKTYFNKDEFLKETRRELELCESVID